MAGRVLAPGTQSWRPGTTQDCRHCKSTVGAGLLAVLSSSIAVKLLLGEEDWNIVFAVLCRPRQHSSKTALCRKFESNTILANLHKEILSNIGCCLLTFLVVPARKFGKHWEGLSFSCGSLSEVMSSDYVWPAGGVQQHRQPTNQWFLLSFSIREQLFLSSDMDNLRVRDDKGLLCNICWYFLTPANAETNTDWGPVWLNSSISTQHFTSGPSIVVVVYFRLGSPLEVLFTYRSLNNQFVVLTRKIYIFFCVRKAEERQSLFLRWRWARKRTNYARKMVFTLPRTCETES